MVKKRRVEETERGVRGGREQYSINPLILLVPHRRLR